MLTPVGATVLVIPNTFTVPSAPFPPAPMELTPSEVWSQVLGLARERMPELSFRTWLHGTQAVAVHGSEILVEVPSDFHAEWIEDRYGSHLAELAARVTGQSVSVTFRSASSSPAPTPADVPVLEAEAPPSQALAPLPPIDGEGTPCHGSLNERYTFDRFVVGNNNQLATAASRAVAENPGRSYNPLFLYGGVGLGKTHLMHAVGHEILKRTPRSRVAYVTTEQFMNELVRAIQQTTTREFRQRFRQIDLLLVDDVHFLERKDSTQEEFFHTFNALYDAGKQVILTSDRPPKELPGVEERLVSRFEWGLVADIKMPDYETRVAILQKKAADDDLTLDDEVIDFIARSCTSSVRELEGAVIKLLAYSSLRREEINVALARSALEGVIRNRGDDAGVRLTAGRIRDQVAEEWGVSAADLASKRRTRQVTVPRQVAMYLIKELMDESLVRIGEGFGGRDHSTVIHSIRKVENTLEGDPDFARRVLRVRRALEPS